MFTDLTLPLIAASFGMGSLSGYFFYKFFIGGWTNKEVDALVHWVVNHPSIEDMKGLSLKEMLLFYQEYSSIKSRLDQLERIDERKRKRGIFKGVFRK